MEAQHGKLEKQSGIEHHIGILLIGEYPLILSGTHAGPARNGFAGGISPVVEIANDTAQQPVVCGRNPVVIVERNGSQRRNIYFKFLPVVDMAVSLGFNA